MKRLRTKVIRLSTLKDHQWVRSMCAQRLSEVRTYAGADSAAYEELRDMLAAMEASRTNIADIEIFFLRCDSAIDGYL